ncbi:MAG TPA: hypothetical protein VLE47_00400 [Candidatus Saccharimonadales bacterium]|nr:hypothetical protein [Candidatus Saccharimonadales bacterium]
MGIETHLPTLALVLSSAAIDGVNPCAIGVLILLISMLMSSGRSVSRMLLLGGLYIFAVFATYLVAGLGLVYFLGAIPLFVTEYLSILVGILIVLAGLVEIKDFFWYQRGFSLGIPVSLSQKIEGFAKNTTVIGVILLGIFVAAVELPCTGAPYLAILTILSLNFDAAALGLLVLYNLVFVAPLIIILFLAVFGTSLGSLSKWRQESRGYMRLFIGLLLVALGWILILLANGTINFG